MVVGGAQLPSLALFPLKPYLTPLISRLNMSYNIIKLYMDGF